MDRDGTILWANRAELELLGYAAEEYIGRSITEFHTDPAVIQDILARLKRNETLHNYEARLRCKDGSIRHVLLTSDVLWKDGRFVHSRCFTRDITERRRAEEALGESEERFRTMADSAPNFVWTAGPDRRFTYVNRRWLEFTGRSADEELGHGWTGRVHADDLPACFEEYREAFAERRPFELELRLRRRDGEYRWLLQSGSPRFEASGRFAGFVGSAVDITERKRGEAEHARLLEEAEAATRSRDEFLATLSHELRTPLNAIVGWAQVLRSGTLTPELATRAVEVIDRNARAQAQLVSDMLDVSRVVAGRLRMNMTTVDLAPVVEEALDTVRPAADAKGVGLEASLDPDGGPVSGDAERLQQVVWTLLSNAVKFTPGGGRVLLTVARVESHVEIRVEDTGVGIEPSFLPHLFVRFRQADSSITRPFGGLGLGLAIVRHLVELHGGTVSARSDGPGRGAVFTIKLPLLILPSSEAAERERRLRAPAVPVVRMAPDLCLKGVKVLVVDDDADSRELIAAILLQRGALMEAAADAEAALEALIRFQPDVLLSDVDLPEQSGYTLIRRVRALPPQAGGRVPAAAITTYARRDDRMQALLAGFQIHLVKPVQPGELVTVVASLAGRTPAP